MRLWLVVAERALDHALDGELRLVARSPRRAQRGAASLSDASSMAEASAAGSSGGTSSPVSPSRTSSRSPPATLVAMTGRPACMASTTRGRSPRSGEHGRRCRRTASGARRGDSGEHTASAHPRSRARPPAPGARSRRRSPAGRDRRHPQRLGQGVDQGVDALLGDQAAEVAQPQRPVAPDTGSDRSTSMVTSSTPLWMISMRRRDRPARFAWVSFRRRRRWSCRPGTARPG